MARALVNVADARKRLTTRFENAVDNVVDNDKEGDGENTTNDKKEPDSVYFSSDEGQLVILD